MNREKWIEHKGKRLSILSVITVWVFAAALSLVWSGALCKVWAAEMDGKTAAVTDEKVSTKPVVKKPNGWQTVNNCKYYYKNGVKAKGWTRIKGKYYYFSKKGELQTNRIAGSKSSGYYYVDAAGVRVMTKEIRSAVAFVVKNSSAKQTADQRLEACFKALCRYPYQRIYGDKPSAKMISSYASYMLNKKQGNCYRYASAMAYIARVLGYDCRVAVGGVTSRVYGSLSPHGWCEVRTGNVWKVYDCSMQRAWTGKKLHDIKRSDYPFRLRCDHVYTMNSKNGKISWK